MNWQTIKKRWASSATMWLGYGLTIVGTVVEVLPSLLELASMSELQALVPPAGLGVYTSVIGILTIAARARTLFRS